MATSFAELVEAGALPARAKILVIDDEPDVFALLTQHFRDSARRSTHDLLYAADGREALDRLRDHPDIDVALADLNMPRLDGFGFLEVAPSINPALKTVVISAYGDMTNVRRAMNKGAFDFLVKPIDLDDLDVTVEKALRHARAVRRVVQSTEQVARAAPVESIRATIVFVGISGWIAASERLRPEEAVRALNAHFDVVAPEITGRGGLVDKILGPAMLVVFRGDQHAQRAVSACVAARRRLDEMAGAAGTGVAGRLSAGIDSGHVVACSLGSATLARLDETVLGRAVGAAARLHTRARSGEILVTEAVHRAVEPFFVTQEIEARRDEKVERAFCIVQETTEPRAARLEVAHFNALHLVR